MSEIILIDFGNSIVLGFLTEKKNVRRLQMEQVPLDLVPVNPAEARVKEVGKLAVEEYNRKHKTELSFVAVVGGFKGNVVGFKFYALVLETQEPNRPTTVDKAFVLENPDKSLNLIKYWV